LGFWSRIFIDQEAFLHLSQQRQWSINISCWLLGYRRQKNIGKYTVKADCIFSTQIPPRSTHKQY